MKAILIDAVNREVRDIVIHENEPFLEQAYDHINCDMIEPVYFDEESKNVGYVDEEGMLKQPKNFFTIKGGYQPYAGNCLIIGDDGEGGNADTTLTADDVRGMVEFMDIHAVRRAFA